MSKDYPCIYFEKDGVCRKFTDDTVISYCVMGPCPELFDQLHYCQECQYFDAVMVPEYRAMSIGAGAANMVPAGDTLIKCKSWHVCGRAVDTALKLKEAER